MARQWGSIPGNLSTMRTGMPWRASSHDIVNSAVLQAKTMMGKYTISRIYSHLIVALSPIVNI